IPLLVWQSGPISPYAAAGITAIGGNISPTFLNSFPSRPFDPSVASGLPGNFADTNQNTVSHNLRNPFLHSAWLSLQHQFHKHFLLELFYFGARGTKLCQRRDLNTDNGWQITSNPQPCPCATVTLLPRLQPNRGAIIEISNGALSNYHALEF